MIVKEYGGQLVNRVDNISNGWFIDATEEVQSMRSLRIILLPEQTILSIPDTFWRRFSELSITHVGGPWWLRTRIVPWIGCLMLHKSIIYELTSGKTKYSNWNSCNISYNINIHRSNHSRHSTLLELPETDRNKWRIKNKRSCQRKKIYN